MNNYTSQELATAIVKFMNDSVFTEIRHFDGNFFQTKLWNDKLKEHITVSHYSGDVYKLRDIEVLHGDTPVICNEDEFSINDWEYITTAFKDIDRREAAQKQLARDQALNNWVTKLIGKRY